MSQEVKQHYIEWSNPVRTNRLHRQLGNLFPGPTAENGWIVWKGDAVTTAQRNGYPESDDGLRLTTIIDFTDHTGHASRAFVRHTQNWRDEKGIIVKRVVREVLSGRGEGSLYGKLTLTRDPLTGKYDRSISHGVKVLEELEHEVDSLPGVHH